MQNKQEDKLKRVEAVIEYSNLENKDNNFDWIT